MDDILTKINEVDYIFQGEEKILSEIYYKILTQLIPALDKEQIKYLKVIVNGIDEIKQLEEWMNLLLL